MQASCQADWSRYHVSAPPPNALSKRIAISWDIPEQQLMISENCLRLTPSLLATSVKMSPSLHISPHDDRSTRKKAVFVNRGVKEAIEPLRLRASFSSARLAPRLDGPLTHLALPRGETCRPAARVNSHAGGVTRPEADGVTPSRSRNVAPRSPRSRAGVARNPLGDGHLQSSALSFVGGDHPDRHPLHSAPRMSRSPPRLPRDF